MPGARRWGSILPPLLSGVLAYGIFLPALWQGGSLLGCAAVLAVLALTVLLPGTAVLVLVADKEGGMPFFTAWALISGFGLSVHILLALIEGIFGVPGLTLVGAGFALLVLIWKRGRHVLAQDWKGEPRGGVLLLVSGLFVFVVLVATFFLYAPSSRHSLPYVPYVDVPWHIGNIYAAQRGFPLVDLRVLGETLDYHVWIYLHLGSLARTAGVDPEMMLLAYFPCYASGFLVVGAVGAAQALAAETGVSARWLPLAPLLVLLSSEFDFSVGADQIFGSWHLQNLGLSPTYALSLVLLLPTLTWALIGSGRWADSPSPPARIRTAGVTMLPLLLLFFACSGSKGSVVPLLVAAAAFSALVAAISRQGMQAVYWGSVSLLAGVVLVVSVSLLYRGVPSSGLQIEFFSYAGFLATLPGYAWSGVDGESVLSRLAIILVFLLGALNVKWLGLRALYPLDARTAWFAGVCFAGLAVFVSVTFTNHAQSYFMIYAAPVLGLLLWQLVASGWIRPRARRGGRASGWTAIVLPAAASVAIAASIVDPVLDVWGRSDRPIRGKRSDSPTRLDTDFIAATEWIRKYTDPHDGILANAGGRPGTGRLFNLSGYGGRQVYLEGWHYHARSFDDDGLVREAGEAFPEHTASLEAIFLRGDLDELVRLREGGEVSWVFLDSHYPCHDAVRDRFPVRAVHGRYSILDLREEATAVPGGV